MESEDLIKFGDHIVIKRQEYMRLHELNAKLDIYLGKDRVNLEGIIGKRYWSVFKMIPKVGSKREFYLIETEKMDSIPDAVMKEISSGVDNRHITDDGKSQTLSTEEIVEMRESGLSAQGIVGKLIENSTTFKDKTEFSQEKYLKKKEKKYFEFIIVKKPTIRLISDILFAKDSFKVMGLRYDTIAQILSYTNIQSNGTYLLFENGTQALIGAAILNSLSTNGQLINLSVGNQPQKQAILNMNFSKEQLNRFSNVKISDLLGNLHETDETSNGSVGQKRKLKMNDQVEAKRARWMEVLETSTNYIQENKVDGLIFVCKEYPSNLIKKLLPFLKPSRQIVIYSLHREPLVEIYLELKNKGEVIGLHIFENFLRNYQVLPDRTHPDVRMSSSGGHILVGTKIIV